MENTVEKVWPLCLGCLSTQKLYNMHEYRLIRPYQLLTGLEIPSSLSTSLCYLCATLLLKYIAFRHRCIETKALLDNAAGINMVNKFQPYTKSEMYITEYPETQRKELSILEVTVDCKTVINDSPSVKTEMDILPEDEIKIETDIVTDMLEIQTKDIKKTKRYKGKIRKSKRSKDLKKETEEIKEKNDDPVKFKQKGRYFETKENMANFQRIFDCDIRVLSKEEQIQDVKERRDFNHPYRCDDCFKGFMDEANLTKHNLTWHDPSRGAAVCDVCKIRYKGKRDLNRHLKSHRLKFTCRQCNHVCKNTSKAMEHFKMHGGQLYECNHCGKTYEKQSTYLTHMRVVHPSALIWCELCGESFVSNFGLNGHKKLAHRDLTYPPDTICVKCNTKFLTPDALRRHADADCESLASCIHCGESFGTRLLLKDHLVTHRPNALVGNFPCVKCNKSFPRQNLYSAHYRRVHADSSRRGKQFMCELCGKALPNKCELRYHQRTHTGERPFICPHCPKSFIKRAFMKSHMRVHSSERPFACKLCPKTFKGPAALSGHQYVHTGMKPPVRRKKKVPYVIDTTLCY